MSGTIIRTLCLALALVNQILSACGCEVLPIGDEMIADLVSAGVTVLTALIAWWKNNSFTEAAKYGDEAMRAMRRVTREGN